MFKKINFLIYNIIKSHNDINYKSLIYVFIGNKITWYFVKYIILFHIPVD